ncbi:MAG: 4-(cytidine 5'-diphospho)-2-C-methyl-D-erythritol kinase [Gaiellaceae bacterium]
MHEVVTVYQRIGIADRIELEPAHALLVEGFPGDTLVRGALGALAVRAGVEPGWHVRIEKRLPIAAGIGGGSSDAATALRLANSTLAAPLPDDDLRALAATLGADVPFFLADGPQLGTGDGGELAPLDLPQDFWVLLVVPRAVEKPSTASVYADFDRRDGPAGFDERRASLFAALEQVQRPRDLAALPSNDLASSPLADELRRLGAFRADVTGAGPAVFGLFQHKDGAKAAQRALKAAGETWLTAPAWYG